MEFFQCSEIQQEEHFMRNENKDWKPEVGKTAWAMFGCCCQQVSVTKVKEVEYFGEDTVWIEAPGFGERTMQVELLHPTHWEALKSIKVYDLQGNEVLPPPRRSVEEVIDEYKKSPEYAERRKVEGRALQIMLSDEAARMNWSWDDCMRMASENPAIPDHTHLLHHFVGVCSECGKSIELDPPTSDAMTKLATTAYSMDLSYKPEREGDGC